MTDTYDPKTLKNLPRYKHELEAARLENIKKSPAPAPKPLDLSKLEQKFSKRPNK